MPTIREQMNLTSEKPLFKITFTQKDYAWEHDLTLTAYPELEVEWLIDHIEKIATDCAKRYFSPELAGLYEENFEDKETYNFYCDEALNEFAKCEIKLEVEGKNFEIINGCLFGK